mmetsp:Transcript_15764/g.50551  ORF Transcript_15764/g.50551 Transcript_15764/m.50551 type:complete len:575 (+) Transcript_15764:262-1986(+)
MGRLPAEQRAVGPDQLLQRRRQLGEADVDSQVLVRRRVHGLQPPQPKRLPLGWEARWLARGARRVHRGDDVARGDGVHRQVSLVAAPLVLHVVTAREAVDEGGEDIVGARGGAAGDGGGDGGGVVRLGEAVPLDEPRAEGVGRVASALNRHHLSDVGVDGLEPGVALGPGARDRPRAGRVCVVVVVESCARQVRVEGGADRVGVSDDLRVVCAELAPVDRPLCSAATVGALCHRDGLDLVASEHVDEEHQLVRAEVLERLGVEAIDEGVECGVGQLVGGHVDGAVLGGPVVARPLALHLLELLGPAAADAWLGEQLLDPRPSRAVVVADVAAVAVPPAGRLQVDLVDDCVEAVEVEGIAREAHGLECPVCRVGEGCDVGEHLSLAVAHVVHVPRPGLEEPLPVPLAEHAALRDDRRRDRVRVELELGDDAREAASAALGHVEHVWVHVLGRELPLAVGVHELDPAQLVAREAEPLREHAPPAPERQARHADAALGAARDDAAVLGELVVQLAPCVPGARRRRAGGGVVLEGVQVADVDDDASGAAGVVLEPVRAGSRARVYPCGDDALDRRLHL